MSLLGFLLDMKKDKVQFTDFWSEKILGGYKSKVVAHKKLVFQNGIYFLIRCILDHAQHLLMDFLGNFSVNLESI